MSSRIDLADLVAALVSMTSPSREMDRIVHVMLAGARARREVSTVDVRLGTWIDGTVQSYTAGGRALSVLAFRRGLDIEVTPHGCGFTAVARGDGEVAVSGLTEAGAACAAIAAHVAASRDIAETVAAFPPPRAYPRLASARHTG